MSHKSDPCYSVFKPFKKEQILLFGQCVISILLGLLSPFMLSRLVNSATINGSKTEVVTYGALTAVVILVHFVADWWQNNHWHSFVLKCVVALRGEVFKQLLHKPLEYFENYGSGDVLNRVLNDTQIYAQNRAITTLMLLLNFIRIGGILTFMYILDVRLAALVTVFLPLYYLFFHWLNQYLRKANRQERESYSKVLHSAQEKIHGIETIHFYQKQNFTASIFKQKQGEYLRVGTRLFFFRSLGTSTNSLMLALLPLALIFFGGMMVLNGSLVVGSLVAFYAYLPYLEEPINNLSDWNLGRQGALAVQERVWDLFETDQQQGAKQQIDVARNIEFDNISFMYEMGIH